MIRLAALLLTLGACTPASDPPEAEGVANAVDAPLNALPEEVKGLPIGAAPPVDLGGEWRVAGINGEAFDDRWTPTATITDDTIRIQSQCVWFERRYRLDAMRLQPPEAALEEEPQAMCARGWTAAEEAMQRALLDAQWAYRLPDGALVLDGPAGSITLFTQ